MAVYLVSALHRSDHIINKTLRISFPKRLPPLKKVFLKKLIFNLLNQLCIKSSFESIISFFFLVCYFINILYRMNIINSVTVKGLFVY